MKLKAQDLFTLVSVSKRQMYTGRVYWDDGFFFVYIRWESQLIDRKYNGSSIEKGDRRRVEDGSKHHVHAAGSSFKRTS